MRAQLGLGNVTLDDPLQRFPAVQQQLAVSLRRPRASCRPQESGAATGLLQAAVRPMPPLHPVDDLLHAEEWKRLPLRQPRTARDKAVRRHDPVRARVEPHVTMPRGDEFSHHVPHDAVREIRQRPLGR